MSLRSGTVDAVVCVILLIAGSFNGTGTNEWSEGPSDFRSGTAINTTTANGDIGLDRNLACPANWTFMQDGAGAPFDYNGYSMAYDDINDTIVLFTGGIWTCNLSSSEWKRSGAKGPAGRHGAAIAFDSANGLVVFFGGWRFIQSAGTIYCNDTWVYDVKADQWTQRAPAIAPSPRSGHTLTYDPADGVMVLFGGEIYDGGQSTIIPLNDTWTYNVSTDTWERMSPAGPPLARSQHAAAFDRASSQMVLFGGWGGIRWNGNAYVPIRLGDTWTYDVSSDQWTNRTPSPSPEARTEHAMSFDAASGSAVLFGGQGGRGLLGDTWNYDAGTNAWTERTPQGSPTPQCRHAMAYDSSAGQSVLFTGRNEHGNLSELWSYHAGLNRWTCHNSRSSPAPRLNHAMAYDCASERTFLFGGEFAWGRSNDIWCYDAGSNSWSCPPESLQTPTARQWHALVYDSKNGLLVLFGGTDAHGCLDDTWTYNTSTNTWLNMSPPSAPPPRYEHQMVYDTARGIIVLFGGRRQYSPSQSGLLGDTWSYDASANRWTQRTVQPAPSARDKHSMAYDPTRGVAVLFGGSEEGGLLGDTWTYNSTTNIWSNVTPKPSPRSGYDYAMTYGGPGCDVLLFGGWDGSISVGGGTSISHAYPNETWTYRTSTNTWTNRTRPMSPAPRFSAAMAYSAACNTVVMFGGYSSQSLLGDTWAFGSWAYFTEGTYTSRPFDTGGSAYFGALEWNSSEEPMRTSVVFQTRAAGTKEELSARPFRGPGGSTVLYYSVSGQRIDSVNDGNRWFQYRATLKTSNISETPVLRNVTVHYNLMQCVTLLSPAGGENWTGTHRLNWTALDPDNDTLSFDIYLLHENGSLPIVLGLPASASGFDWDTTNVPNGTYRIMVVARDDNIVIPLSANVTSWEFHVFHPLPPNHPPSVTLLAPANNSVIGEMAGLFRWQGEDVDGDQLVYNLTYWKEAAAGAMRRSKVTNATSFNATDLEDNATYDWNVSAFDGRDRSPPSPVWRFEINRTVPNRQPVITSTAPANATAGTRYEYLLLAADPDGDRLTYALPAKPEGMKLGGILQNNSGIRILWTPTKAQKGDWNATVTVTDGRGGNAEQTFRIHVEVVAPRCAITHPAGGATVKGSLRINGTAAKGSAEVSRVEVRIDGGAWKDAVGTSLWSFDIDTTKLGNGNHTIEARATDGDLPSEPAMVRFSVNNGAPQPNPPGLSLEGGPWLIAVAAACAAGILAFIFLRRRKREAA